MKTTILQSIRVYLVLTLAWVKRAGKGGYTA